MNKPFENKLALVTGASRGIGAAIARRLAADGAWVVVNYAASSASAEAVVADIRRAGGHAEAVQADLSRANGPATLGTAIDTAFGEHFRGRLDILVNNAGTVQPGPFLNTSAESYDQHFNLNVRAVIELSKDALKRMTRTGSGRIINIGSAVGEAVPFPNLALYVATKFAVHGFTRALARELGSSGITINGVQPGPIKTELSPPEDAPAAAPMIALTRTGRFGRVEEIAHAVAFLAHPDSAFINGENLTVDGGVNA